jgi:hypothetical protein
MFLQTDSFWDFGHCSQMALILLCGGDLFSFSFHWLGNIITFGDVDYRVLLGRSLLFRLMASN